MGVFVLKNNELTVQIKSFGAELTSIKDNDSQTEYLWSGDEEYWKRQAPVLFPFVGSLKNKEYKWKNKSYSMGQHGFARDMDFNMKSVSNDEIVFELASNDETKKIYPFEFCLNIGYKLQDRKLLVTWTVTNSGSGKLLFSIGGHPAFVCPVTDDEKQTDYYIMTDAKEKIVCGLIGEGGLLDRNKERVISLDNDGAFRLTETLFDEDALIIDNKQVNMLSLASPDKNPYVTMKFDMPLCGIWSPAKKNAPFICLEPWFGRCDALEFEGELQDREYEMSIESGEVFKSTYELEFGKIQ